MILPSAVQCAGRTTPTRSVNWKAPGPLVRASTTTASPMRTEKCALSPVSRDSSSSTGVAQAHHLDFVERARGQREQRAADAVALGILQLAHIAERDHGFHQMEGGGIVQADALGQFRKPDAVAVARDFLDDGETAADRLHAAAARGLRPGRAQVADIGAAGPRRLEAGGLFFDSRGHLACLPIGSARSGGRSGSPNSAFLRLR